MAVTIACAFRASTRPKASDPAHPLFTIPVDRPVCRLRDSILIANESEAVGFLEVARDFGEEFIAGDADAGGP